MGFTSRRIDPVAGQLQPIFYERQSHVLAHVVIRDDRGSAVLLAPILDRIHGNVREVAQLLWPKATSKSAFDPGDELGRIGHVNASKVTTTRGAPSLGLR